VNDTKEAATMGKKSKLERGKQARAGKARGGERIVGRSPSDDFALLHVPRSFVEHCCGGAIDTESLEDDSPGAVIRVISEDRSATLSTWEQLSRQGPRRDRL
jgi:hypothetical protein